MDRRPILERPMTNLLGRWLSVLLEVLLRQLADDLLECLLGGSKGVLLELVLCLGLLGQFGNVILYYWKVVLDFLLGRL